MSSDSSSRKISFFRSLCSCCFLPEQPENVPTKPTNNKASKSPTHTMKDPLMIHHENPLCGLKPKPKAEKRGSSKQNPFGNALFKKNMCNCQFLKELNKNNEMFHIDNTSHYDKFLNSKKMNPEKKKRLSDNFKVLNTLNKYPKNKVFVLKYNAAGLLCKITYRNFKFPFVKKKVKLGTRSLISKRSSAQNTPESNMTHLLQNEENSKISEEIDEKLNIFSKFHQGIKIDSDSFEKILPEKVANYLAKKFKKNSVIVDAVCGVGGTAIQLALEGHVVLAFENNEQRLNFATNNAAIYGVQSKIDIIKCSSENFRCNRKIDAIILSIDYEVPKTTSESFCLFGDTMPDVRKTLENALEITKNVVLVLPKYVDLAELALLFSEAKAPKDQ